MKGVGAVFLLLVLGVANAQPASPLERYVGFYRLGPKLVLTISRDGDHLLAQATHQPALALIPEGQEQFSFQQVPARITFQTNASQVTGLVLHQNGRDLAAPRIDAAVAHAIEDARVAAPAWSMMTGQSVRFLTSGAADYWPCYSPDGQTILFSRTTNGKQWDLFRVPASGGTAIPFAHVPVSATRASWSGKTNTIAFTGTSADGNNAIWTIKADGMGAQAVTRPSSSLFYPSWEPDGKHLAAMDGKALAIVRVDLVSSQSVRLTDPAKVFTGMPSVSPDGRAIILAGQTNNGQSYDQSQNSLWLLEEGGAVHTVEKHPGQGRAPVWSPDGRQIAFESDRGSPDGRYAVFIIQRDGTGLVQVTDYALNANHPVWSPDGRHLVISAVSAGGSRIAVIDLPAP